MAPPRPVVRRCLLAAVACALAATGEPVPAAAVAPSPGAVGAGDAYFPLDGNGGIDVRHYGIHDRYRFRQGRLTGHTVLRVRATQDLSSFDLDFLLPVRAVRVNGVRAGHDRPRRHELRITPRRPLSAGEVFRVRVGYDGRPDRFGYDGERNWLAGRREVVAMNQPHMAPWWFPSSDHPSDKARIDVSVTVPRGKQVLSNGRPVSRRRHGRLVTHHWRADEPIASYLAMFAAGSFQVEHGVDHGLPWRIAVSRRLPAYSRNANVDLLRRTPGVIRALEHDLGRYPFSTSGGLVTGLPVGFALENQTMPTYPELDRSYLLFVVHEQAHQWFGDSVALRRWRDIWLNEGAATFMERRYRGRHGGQSAAAWLRRRYDAAQPGFWDLAIGDPGAGRIFDDAVYTRGAMTFQALRNRIGDEEFWTLLRRWVRVHRDGHGTTAGFRSLAEAVSGEDLGAFFDAWLGSGRPDDIADNGLG